MYLTVHATIGAVLGERVDPPLAGFLLGFASHFLADVVPHGDEWVGRTLAQPGRVRWLAALALIDGLAAGSLVTLLWLGGAFVNPVGAFSGALGAVLPDVLAGFSDLSQGKLWPAYVRLHNRSHRLLGREVPLPVGGAMQLCLLAALCLFEAGLLLKP